MTHTICVLFQHYERVSDFCDLMRIEYTIHNIEIMADPKYDDEIEIVFESESDCDFVLAYTVWKQM